MKTVKEYLKYTFSDQETLTFARSIASEKQQLDGAQETLDNFRAQMKADITTHENEIVRLSRLINQGYEYRQIDCEVLYHTPEDGKKTIRRCDTGEVVKVAAMTPEEMQAELPFEEDTEPTDGATSCQITVLHPDGSKGASVSFGDPVRTMQRAATAIKNGAELPKPEEGVVRSAFSRKHVNAEIVVREDECGWTGAWRVRTRTTSDGDDALGTFDAESLARAAAAKAIRDHVQALNGSAPDKAKANLSELLEWCGQWIGQADSTEAKA